MTGEINPIDSDVHDRQKRVSGWNQDKIEAANVAIIGAGALGNEVAKNLLQLGVSRLSVVDFDTVVKANLNRCVLFTEEDAENKVLKAEGIRRVAAKKLNPNAIVMPIIKNVETLDDKFFSQFTAVFGCLDNLGARLHVNANCYGAVPLIDGGTTGFFGKVQVVNKPSPCIECAMSKHDYDILWRKYSCTGEQLDIFRPHDLFGIAPGAVDPFGDAAGRMVDKPIDDLAAEVAHPQGIGVGEGHGDPKVGLLPGTRMDQLVDLTADVLPGALNEREQFVADSMMEDHVKPQVISCIIAEIPCRSVPLGRSVRP